MFYKFFEDGRRKSVDMNDIYFGEACFIICAGPSLQEENLELLNERGIFTLAVNNAAEVVKPTFWVGGDAPRCYSERILRDPSILKFANFGKKEMMVGNLPWRLIPGTLFYPCSDSFTINTFLDRHRDLVWWKNSFYIAIQLAWRLGFRSIYLLGAEFNITKDNQYAYPTDLKDDELKLNQTLYSKTVQGMGELKPIFESKGFAVQNCSAKSALVDIYGHIPLWNAVEQATMNIPKEIDTSALPHCRRKSD